MRRSVFGQLMSEADLLKWDSMRLRRSYSHIQDAGQKRCFFVKFESEGVDDHGGPYRAVFQLAAEEEPAGSLGILVPCPNAEGAMQNTDKMVFNTRVDVKQSSSEDSSVLSEAQVLECCYFLGRLVGISTRHDINVALNLPGLIWRALVGLPSGWKELHEIDSFTTLSLRKIEMLSESDWAAAAETWSDILGDRLNTVNKDLVRYQPDLSRSKGITYESRLNVLGVIVEDCLRKGETQLEEFTRGLNDVLPVELFPFFTPNELEALICGEPEIDVGLLQRATVYENVDENAPHVSVHCSYICVDLVVDQVLLASIKRDDASSTC